MSVSMALARRWKLSRALFCVEALSLLFLLTSGSAAAHVQRQRHARGTPSSRRLRIRDLKVGQAHALSIGLCNNTAQGRWSVTDDRGRNCPHDAVSPATGCCTTGEQYSCTTCNLGMQCCEQYEQCVSCCLAPKYDAVNVYKRVYRSTGRPETGRWDSAFDYCRGKCRTTSRSTVHENAYLAPAHHCFSETGKPKTVEPPTPELAEGVQPVVAVQGASCVAACEAAGAHCIEDQLPALNNCNILRDFFACEAGCVLGSEADEPSYMVGAAPKQQRPTMCFTRDISKGPFSCSTLHANSQRLCACSSAPAQNT